MNDNSNDQAAPEATPQRSKLNVEDGVFRFLFVAYSHFTGSFEENEFALTVTFPSFDRRGSELLALQGPHPRSMMMFSFVTSPPKPGIGVVVPTYTHVGEEMSALLGAFFGKFIANAGHMQAGQHLTVPAKVVGPCYAHSKAPFNSSPRRPDGPPLELQRAALLVAAYVQETDTDGKLAPILYAAEFYRLALENYDTRADMAFALLISALEALAEPAEYTEGELYDPQLRDDLAAIAAGMPGGEAIVGRLKGRFYQVRRKLAAFVDATIPESFFQQRETTLEFGFVKERLELRKRLLAAYDVRSRLLHTGNRTGMAHLESDYQGTEFVLGTPVLPDAELKELLCTSLNLVGLERVVSTVLRLAINRWLDARAATRVAPMA